MRNNIILAALTISTVANAQYGSFDKKVVDAAKSSTTTVLRDATDSPYNRDLMNAVKAHWKFTGGTAFGTITDLASMPLDPATTYLMKIRKSDKEKHDAIFLALVQGWKMKKGETLMVENNAVTNLPPDQELASIMIDAKLMDNGGSAMLNVYVKNLQDYLKQVETGKIADKATADRLYASRNRYIKDMELWVAEEQLDKSLPDLAAIQETYKQDVKIMGYSGMMTAASQGQPNVAIADVVITGEYKTKWCFRRVFNASTGELMYQRDEAALHDKKMGFIKEDFRVLEQSR
ncbi:MAG: hypothetical protein K8H89_10090 [Flavobacteriales bacterium]|jgi:hypothetical protein|nr:hypothetical protein [Flavobacteriales bacterium]MCB0759306.1 hypothetical protein [Flavobacteriales bacterium]